MKDRQDECERRLKTLFVSVGDGRLTKESQALKQISSWGQAPEKTKDKLATHRAIMRDYVKTEYDGYFRALTALSERRKIRRLVALNNLREMDANRVRVMQGT